MAVLRRSEGVSAWTEGYEKHYCHKEWKDTLTVPTDRQEGAGREQILNKHMDIF